MLPRNQERDHGQQCDGLDPKTIAQSREHNANCHIRDHICCEDPAGPSEFAEFIGDGRQSDSDHPHVQEAKEQAGEDRDHNENTSPSFHLVF